MPPNSKVKEFPDIGSKLAAPTKKSLFEKQKAEAEAKRQREQEETAAVYEDFVKSFDDTGDDSLSADVSVGDATGSGNSGSNTGGFGGSSKRHFSGQPPGLVGKSGRGNSGPGSLGPPPSLSRKRALDGSRHLQKEPSSGLFAFDDPGPGPLDAKSAFRAEEEEEDQLSNSRTHERAAPKPTLKLSSLPPGTSPAVIKSILPAVLSIDGVKILAPTGPGSTERRSLSAIVTLAKDTPAIDIDTAVSALQNKYLGRGYYLSLSRYLSSAAVVSELPVSGLSSATSSLPFGAQPIPAGPASNFNRGPPGSYRSGFAPPQSYAPSGPGQVGKGAPSLQVVVNPPANLNQLKLIHKTVEALLTYGPEFEALLMSRKDIQQEERWAWLWDSRSMGGVYYRWRLWDILSGASAKQARNRGNTTLSSQIIFEGGAVWAAPEKGLPFEYATRLEEFVSDSEYDSSDEEDSGNEGRRRYLHHHGGAPPPANANVDGDSQAYLNPLHKAKLAHLLARLPTSNAKLRRGDVARITAFAIEHAGEGAEEVVQMITANVQKPFAFCTANPDYRGHTDDAVAKDEDEIAEEDKRTTEKEDTSSSQLIGLFVISDILSSSSTSGVRHAWRYRQLFEAVLKQSQVFETLGRLEKTMHWGRMRAEKWKRSVGSILTLWEGWCVFPQVSQEHLTKVFSNPPLTLEEEAAIAAAQKASAVGTAAKSRWRTVDENSKPDIDSAVHDNPAQVDVEDNMDVDIDGAPMADDENLDGEPMDDGDLDGEPMDDGDLDGEPMDEDEEMEGHDKDLEDDALDKDIRDKPALPGSLGPANSTLPNQDFKDDKSNSPQTITRRRRPKAEDMFADSDGE